MTLYVIELLIRIIKKHYEKNVGIIIHLYDQCVSL